MGEASGRVGTNKDYEWVSVREEGKSAGAQGAGAGNLLHIWTCVLASETQAEQ